MEIISSIQESDTSAIDRIEKERANQRQELVDAANAATKRAALLKSGVGVAAAALGVGFGVLMVLYGISLLVGRPTLDEVARAMSVQAASMERIANEKVTAAQIEAAKKGATAEKAVAEKSVAAKVAADEAAALKAEALAVTEKFKAAPLAKTVVDFTIFRKQETNRLVIITGWKYRQVGDRAPSDQYCHVLRASESDGLQLGIAHDGNPLPFNQERAARAGVTFSDVQQALPYCDWFKGANPNIREKIAGLP